MAGGVPAGAVEPGGGGVGAGVVLESVGGLEGLQVVQGLEPAAEKRERWTTKVTKKKVRRERERERER